MNSPRRRRWLPRLQGDALERAYLKMLPEIRRIARQRGYAVGVHGSMRRDLDLIAAPWREKHCTPEVLARAIQWGLSGFRHKLSIYTQEFGTLALKPCGRRTIILAVGMTALLDLSVMPAVCKKGA